MSGVGAGRVARPRILTPAEKRLVAAILSGSDVRVATGELPRSTRQAVISRIYVREWIRDRYVPRPAESGWPLITFAMVEPFVDRLPEVTTLWQNAQGVSLLWASDRRLFGVFHFRNGSERAELWTKLFDPEFGRVIFHLDQDLLRSAVPIYFDFEAAWARVAGLPGSVAYPQSLPIHVRPGLGTGGLGLLSPAERAAIEQLVIRPFVGGARIPRSGSGLRLLLGRTERRCLTTGLVEARSFLNPIGMSVDLSDFPNSVGFIHGTLLFTATPEAMFRELVEKASVSPFLLATDGRYVVIGALSLGRQASRGERGTSGDRIVSILRKHLQSITIVEERLDHTRVLLDHRYDRLVSE